MHDRIDSRFRGPQRSLWGAALGAVLLLAACAGTPPEPAPGAAALGDHWFERRSAALGLSLDETRARDAAFSTESPPYEIWDDGTRREAAALWRDLCASCHGARGRVEGVPVIDPSPRRWDGMGPSMGFFFGGDDMRAGIYQRILRGGDADGNPSVMKSFEALLAREQIWLLVFLIEEF